jgi:2-dehydro-3-deoxyglucarate aldolase
MYTAKRKFNYMSNSLKGRILSGQLTIGSWVTLAHPAIAEIMAQAGFDWLTIDLEHSAITIREAEELIRVSSLSGVPPLVRLTSNDSNQIKRVMDAGAHGVIVPMVNSREDAKKAVQSLYYPPVGQRGVGLARAQGYGTSFSAYQKWLEDEAVIIVMIEHIDAVNNLEEILTVPGIDGFIIGPYDLSTSMGIPGRFEDSRMVEAIEKIRTVSSALGKTGGLHVVEPDSAKLREAIGNGFRFLAYSLDIRILDVHSRLGLEECRK